MRTAHVVAERVTVQCPYCLHAIPYPNRPRQNSWPVDHAAATAQVRCPTCGEMCEMPNPRGCSIAWQGLPRAMKAKRAP